MDCRPDTGRDSCPSISFRCFAIGTHGNVSTLFALLAFSLTMAAGIAIDFARLVSTKTALSAAIDAAALQAGSSRLTNDEALEALAQKVLERNYPDAGHGPIVEFDLRQIGRTISISTTARFQTSFMRIAGIDHIDLPASSEVTKSGNNLEVAMVLDATGSMRGNRLQSLKTAAKDFVDAVVWEDQTDFYSKVAVVPYSVGVNLGARAETVRGGSAASTCNLPGCESYRFRNANRDYKTFHISTCVSERTGDHAYDDVSPAIAPVGRNYTSSNNPCLDSELRPLDTDKTAIKAAIDALTAGGSTAGQIGIAWGWYALSHDFGLWTGASQPAPYHMENVNKIAVIMTDGAFNTGYCNGVIARNSESGSGYTEDKINCDADNGSASSQALRLCAEMKKKGITIYTVGFDIGGDDTALTVMTGCASDPNHAYLAASDEELRTAFRQIGQRVTALRLSK